MAKIALIIVAVAVVDFLLLIFAQTDVDQVGVARAFAAYAENPTEGNLRIKEARSAAANQQQARIRLFSSVGILVVTSAGAFVIGRIVERRCHEARLMISANGTPTI
jgi:rhamnose utilization protein RhaD (predicted bifunctional aldolase and dehydrogenase)